MIEVVEMQTDAHILDVRDLAVAHHDQYGGATEFDTAAVCASCRTMQQDRERVQDNCWIAYVDGKAVGYLASSCVRNYYSWRNIATQQVWYVLPAYRGTRAGVLLVKALEKWARKHNCEAVYMGVEHDVYSDETARTVKLIGALGYNPRGVYAIKHLG
jgi:GNAT superfamily N-acetyltransferase